MIARQVRDNINKQLSCDLVKVFHIAFKRGGQRYDIVGYMKSMDVSLKRTTKQFDHSGGFKSK